MVLFNVRKIEIYHFLLPDMDVGWGYWKDDFEDKTRYVSTWQKPICALINGEEFFALTKLSKNHELEKAL
jgi:hypothetical protein